MKKTKCFYCGHKEADTYEREIGKEGLTGYEHVVNEVVRAVQFCENEMDGLLTRLVHEVIVEPDLRKRLWKHWLISKYIAAFCRGLTVDMVEQAAGKEAADALQRAMEANP